MAERIDALASLRHYADHLAPIWLALLPEHRGTFYASHDVAAWMARSSAPHPVEATVGFPDRTSNALVLVAGIKDHADVNPRQTVLLNHGAGQSYAKEHGGRGAGAYAGGPNRERVLLNLEPGPLGAKAAANAGQLYVKIGCPKLDPWHDGSRPTRVEPGLVAVGFHHQPPQHCPEQQTAWGHYADAWPALAKRVTLLGHGHPRGWERTANYWAKIGVEAEPDFAQVLDRAAVYITDISSTGVEFASTGRSVIWCNAPWYRRDIEHDGRFWSWLEHSLYVNGPDDLEAAIRYALGHGDSLAAWQQPMVESAYVATDGKAAERAAAAIVALLTS